MKTHDSLRNVSSWSIYIFTAVFVFIPTFFIFLMSFLDADALGNISLKFTLDNFRKAMDPMYMKVLLSSVKISIITTISTLTIAYPLAYIVSKLDRKSQLILMLLIIMPYWTNSLVRTYSFLVILRADGIINKLLMLFGVIGEPLQLLYTEWAVIFTMIYLHLPVMFLPIYSSIEKLDSSYIEASRDLGAGRLATFTKIIFPLTVPGIVAGSILVFTPCLGLFFISDLIGGGKTVLLGSVIRDQFSATRNLPFGSALSVIMMLMAIVFIVAYYKISLTDNNKENNNE